MISVKPIFVLLLLTSVNVFSAEENILKQVETNEALSSLNSSEILDEAGKQYALTIEWLEENGEKIYSRDSSEFHENYRVYCVSQNAIAQLKKIEELKRQGAYFAEGPFRAN